MCGREVAPMRFRAVDLRPHGWTPPQTFQIPIGAAARRNTCRCPSAGGGGSSCRSGILSRRTIPRGAGSRPFHA